jgi:hypothetical protein
MYSVRKEARGNGKYVEIYDPGKFIMFFSSLRIGLSMF